MWWFEWWAWGALALGLVILEVLAPAYIFLGFGLGAGVIAILLAIGGPIAGFLTGSLAALLAGFALVSLGAWVSLRRALGDRKTQVKTFENDINDA